MLRLIVPPIVQNQTAPKDNSTTETAAGPPFSLGWELSIGNVNAVCMKQPIPHVLGFTEFHLRQFSGMHPAWGIDVDRTLADFSFMPVFTEHIFHEPSDIACHASLLTQITTAIQPTLILLYYMRSLSP
jgi:hypothetical protein